MAQNPKQNTRPVIGVTGNAKRFSPSWLCIRLSLFLVGAKAVRISTKKAYEKTQLQGLVISGGDDIHPALYQQAPEGKAHYDPERDALESEYIAYAFANNLPILGICRGYQLMNVIRGGNLFADIRNMRRVTKNRASLLPTKTVHLIPGSLLHKVFGRNTIKVNSLHHQAIQDLGDNIQPIAFDNDQIAQAISASDLPNMLGVQWHPEYLLYLPSQRAVFAWLVKKAKAYHA